MLTRYKQVEKRLAIIEQLMDKRAQCAATPLYMQVNREAQLELSPVDLPLLQSAEAARGEGRFHSLEEHAVTQKFRKLQDVVAGRYGLGSYGGAIRQYIDSRPQTKSSAKESADVLVLCKILNWGRDNCCHIQKLLKAQQVLPSNSLPEGVVPTNIHEQ